MKEHESTNILKLLFLGTSLVVQWLRLHIFNPGLCLFTQSCLTLTTPWTVACQALLSMEFSRQEYWSGLPFPTQGHFLDPGLGPRSPAWQADSLPVCYL